MNDRRNTPLDKKKLSVVLATDCGSTTTKAILFEKKNDGWHQTYRGEAPTTVEKPVADVTIGAKNAFSELQEISGRKILKERSADSSDESPILACKNPGDEEGVDLYISTSSAGGGLQMVVGGIVSNMTTESAERAALGAGAIVMDSISVDDEREQYEKVKKIRHLRPDIILLAGGTDGGNVAHLLELSEIILQADPKPRFGETLRLPILFAANKDARGDVAVLLEKRFSFTAVENLRPTLDVENLEPARDAIHELFLKHVMSHAPGYKKLMSYSPVPIVPTPAAMGKMVLAAAKQTAKRILAVDIGGATTDVFSVFHGGGEGFNPIFNRTVSANLGMSYSIANVMLESGVGNIRRWLPFDLSVFEIEDLLRNKMIRPTTIPETMEDLLLEQAVCREALRLAFEHHKRLASGLKGLQKKRTIGDMFRQRERDTLVDMFNLDIIVGSGGVLSHAPDRKSAALMLMDAYEPLGVTRLAVDSIFMMPHLGVFSEVHEEAASEIFFRDCIVELGTVVAPLGSLPLGTPMLEVSLDDDTFRVPSGEIKRIELAPGKSLAGRFTPLARTLDLGAGPGRTIEVELRGGEAGIIVDCRGRPLIFRSDELERSVAIRRHYRRMGIVIG